MRGALVRQQESCPRDRRDGTLIQGAPGIGVVRDPAGEQHWRAGRGVENGRQGLERQLYTYEVTAGLDPLEHDAIGALGEYPSRLLGRAHSWQDRRAARAKLLDQAALEAAVQHHQPRAAAPTSLHVLPGDEWHQQVRRHWRPPRALACFPQLLLKLARRQHPDGAEPTGCGDLSRERAGRDATSHSGLNDGVLEPELI
jgi:hypothetical protein